MASRKTAEQISALIGKVESLRNNEGLSIAQACEKAGVKTQNYYRWKKDGKAPTMEHETVKPSAPNDGKEYVQVEKTYWEFINDRLYKIMLELEYLRSQIK